MVLSRYLKGIIILFINNTLIMDIVFVEGLKVDTVIGIYDWEKKIRQDIVLDIEMSSDIAAAAKTDHIDHPIVALVQPIVLQNFPDFQRIQYPEMVPACPFISM